MNKLITICAILALITLSVCIPAHAQTSEELIAVRNDYAKAIDDHDIDAIISHLADDFVVDGTTFAIPLVTPEQVRALWEDLYAASQDWHSSDNPRILASGNIVVVEHASLGTNTREVDGIPWQWPHVDIYEFEGLKIKRHMSYGDYASIYVQLGLMPMSDIPEFVPSITVPDPEPTGLSPLEANAEHVKRWNSHDAAEMAKIYDTDSKIFAGPLGTALDRDAMTAMNEMYFSAFPDVELEIVRVIDLGQNWVVTELVSRSTHQGSFMGIPPMGYPTELRAVWLIRYTANGLLAEGSFYYNNLTLMTQMTTAPYSLDGIWVTSAPTPLGNFITKTIYTAQDAAKTLYSGTLEAITAFPLLVELYPDADPSLFFSAGGQAVMVGRNKYEATYLSYDRKIDENTASLVIVGINTLKAYFEVIGPDQLQGQGTASYYMAAQDADQDGFPDEGEEPVLCAPWEWTSRRLTLIPGCELMP